MLQCFKPLRDLLIAALIFAALSANSTAHASVVAATQNRPFRLGVFRLNPALDTQKPLAVADSAGYVIRDDVIFGSFDRGRIIAWNFKQKRHLWWASTEGEATAPPILIENTLLVSTRSGMIYSFNASSGQKNWEIALDSHSERPLTISGGQLYVVTAGQVAYGIDVASGKRLWVYDAGFPEHITVKRPPAALVYEGRVIFGIASGELVALKADDGKLAWRYNPLYVDYRFHDPVGEMVLMNGKLLLTRYDGLIAEVDMSGDRRVIWQEKTISVSTSTFRGGRYYAGLVSGDVIAYDAANGRSVWRTATGATPSYLIVGESHLYAIATDGRIFAIDITSGEIAWIEDLGSRVAAPPIVTNDRMYISTGLRNVYGFKL